MADQDPETLAAPDRLQSSLPHDMLNPHAEPPHEAAPQRRFGGSRPGRLMWRSRTRTAGIRFEWAQRSSGPVLRVVATWTDHNGQPHHTSYSVQNNGLEGALDRAIASRTSCGAPQPDRQDLLQRLRHEFETSPFAHAQQAGQSQPS
jgi:hypothetical protein